MYKYFAIICLAIASFVGCVNNHQPDVKAITSSERQSSRKINVHLHFICELNNKENHDIYIQRVRDAAKYFSPLHIDFIITEISVTPEDYVRAPVEELHDCSDEEFPNRLNIYIFPFTGYVQGYGFFPWESKSSATVIIYGDVDKDIIAHEIGHSVFGLHHAFTEDYVEDTIPVICTDGFCKSDPNIMSYGFQCPPDEKHFTPGQFERMEKMLQLYRTDIFLK